MAHMLARTLSTSNGTPSWAQVSIIQAHEPLDFASRRCWAFWGGAWFTFQAWRCRVWGFRVWGLGFSGLSGLAIGVIASTFAAFVGAFVGSMRGKAHHGSWVYGYRSWAGALVGAHSVISFVPG